MLAIEEAPGFADNPADILQSKRETIWIAGNRSERYAQCALGKHEPLWFRTPLNMEERVRRLAFLEPSYSFRSTFEYQAIAYGAAGPVQAVGPERHLRITGIAIFFRPKRIA